MRFQENVSGGSSAASCDKWTDTMRPTKISATDMWINLTRTGKCTFFMIIWPCIVTDSLWIKPTDALNSNFNGITTLHVSGSLYAHHQFLVVHWLWYVLCSCDEPFATRSRMELRPIPGSKRSQLHEVYQGRCMAKNSWWWAERLPETCRVVIPIKLEFSASVGFIHKETSVLSWSKLDVIPVYTNRSKHAIRGRYPLWIKEE